MLCACFATAGWFCVFFHVLYFQRCYSGATEVTDLLKVSWNGICKKPVTLGELRILCLATAVNGPGRVKFSSGKFRRQCSSQKCCGPSSEQQKRREVLECSEPAAASNALLPCVQGAWGSPQPRLHPGHSVCYSQP